MAAIRYMLPLLAACGLFGQSSQTFHVTTVKNTAAMNEIATILRTVGGIQQLHADDTKFDITVSGSENDLALAAWVIKQLDTTKPQPAHYPIPGGSDVLNTVYLANTPTQQGLNELVTAIRRVANISQIFTYTPLHGFVVRTTAAQAPMAVWLAKQLDVSPNDQNRWQPHEYAAGGSPEQVVKVVYLIHPTAQPAGLNEMVTTIRTIADMQAIFTRSQPQGIVFRGSVAQAQLGDWLFQQFDMEQPDSQMRAQQHQYVLPGVDDGITRVYYLNSADLNEMVTAIRSETQVRRIFTSTRNRAIAVRGTPEVIAAADRVVKEHDGPADR